LTSAVAQRRTIVVVTVSHRAIAPKDRHDVGTDDAVPSESRDGAWRGLTSTQNDPPDRHGDDLAGRCNDQFD
jgi:hypothetical protein